MRPLVPLGKPQREFRAAAEALAAENERGVGLEDVPFGPLGVLR